MKTNHLNVTGPARWKSAGPRPFLACAARAQGRGRRPSRASAHCRSALPAWLAEVEGLAGACAGTAARLGHEAGGHPRPRRGELASARDAREDGECGRVARRGWRREGRRLPWRPSTAAPWPSVARLGEAQPVLGRRRKRKRDLKEGEAELRARGIGEWRGGAGARRRCSCGRGECRAWGSRLWRRKKAARDGVSERTGCGR